MQRRRQTGNSKDTSLTKRTLVRAVRKGSRDLASKAMRLKGYVVQAENGWIVRIDHRGVRKKISRINGSKSKPKVVLD